MGGKSREDIGKRGGRCCESLEGAVDVRERGWREDREAQTTHRVRNYAIWNRSGRSGREGPRKLRLEE